MTLTKTLFHSLMVFLRFVKYFSYSVDDWVLPKFSLTIDPVLKWKVLIKTILSLLEPKLNDETTKFGNKTKTRASASHWKFCWGFEVHHDLNSNFVWRPFPFPGMLGVTFQINFNYHEPVFKADVEWMANLLMLLVFYSFNFFTLIYIFII